ncbi:histone modifying enzyme [Lithospermum erythrorhizon]|uniref:Histone modifying enzyme n=1 Tax=Lithospermum erythrorhizon TaxID=34254 RepID=A0AAV3P8B1_LITER
MCCDQSPKQELCVKARLPRGVNHGCPSCGNCLEVHTSWRPKESCSTVLENVPVLYPTEEEFNDTLTYISSIRSKEEIWGMCRIVPPSSWKPPCLLQEKRIWESSKFTTRVEGIHELQNICLKSEHRGSYEKCERRKALKGSLQPDPSKEVPSDADSCRCENALDYTLETFKRYAHDFQRQYFKLSSEQTGDEVPSAVNIEGEYWRVIQNPDAEIEVLSAADRASKCLGSGFPVETKSEKGPKDHGYVESRWNLNNIPKLSGSLLSIENQEISVSFVPQLSIGMCFSSQCWNVKEHHLYSLCYSHMGAPSIWYSIPSRYHFKFEEVAKKHFPELLQNPQLFHKLVPQLSPSTLVAEGIPVYRCVQHPGEFVVVFPGVYHAGFSCGFNCSESINFALIDWLPYGQNAVELYSEQCRKTSISYAKVLLGTAMRFVKAQWKLWLMKNTLDDDKWREACGKDGNLAKTLKEFIKQESIRRKYICLPSKSKKMEENFYAFAKQECCICLYDLHLSAAGCPCSPNKYTCLRHAKQICSCPWQTRYFLFRYEISELNMLLEALEGNAEAISGWAKQKLGLTMLSSSQSKSTPSLAGTSIVGSQLVKDPVSVPKICSPAPDTNPGELDTTAHYYDSSRQNCRRRSSVNADDDSRKLPRSQAIVILSDSEDE